MLHGLRTTAAVAMTEFGFSLEEIRAVTGHDSVAALLVYFRDTDKAALSARALAVLSERCKGVADGGEGANTRRAAA